VRWLVGVALAITALTAPAAAAVHKVLVLPVDGALDPATRGKLTAELARLARGLDGQIATGSATFADTALAVGCEPRAASCADEVMATLGVDELVWATATRTGSQTRLVVRRAARGAGRREISTTFATGDASERATAAIAPLFAPPAGPEPAPRPPPPHAVPPPPAEVAAAAEPPAAAPVEPPRAPPAPLPAPAEPRSDRTFGIALTAGGSLAVVLGLAFWASYASLQGSIDNHRIRTAADFEDLRALEDSASTRALAGDVFVIAGVIAGGVGGYLLVRDHRQRAIAIAPAPIARGTGVALWLTIRPGDR
jgi:hypothetical protein